MSKKFSKFKLSELSYKKRIINQFSSKNDSLTSDSSTSDSSTINTRTNHQISNEEINSSIEPNSIENLIIDLKKDEKSLFDKIKMNVQDQLRDSTSDPIVNHHIVDCEMKLSSNNSDDLIKRNKRSINQSNFKNFNIYNDLNRLNLNNHQNNFEINRHSNNHFGLPDPNIFQYIFNRWPFLNQFDHQFKLKDQKTSNHLMNLNNNLSDLPITKTNLSSSLNSSNSISSIQTTNDTIHNCSSPYSNENVNCTATNQINSMINNRFSSFNQSNGFIKHSNEKRNELDSFKNLIVNDSSMNKEHIQIDLINHLPKTNFNSALYASIINSQQQNRELEAEKKQTLKKERNRKGNLNS